MRSPTGSERRVCVWPGSRRSVNPANLPRHFYLGGGAGGPLGNWELPPPPHRLQTLLGSAVQPSPGRRRIPALGKASPRWVPAAGHGARLGAEGRVGARCVPAASPAGLGAGGTRGQGGGTPSLAGLCIPPHANGHGSPGSPRRTGEAPIHRRRMEQGGVESSSPPPPSPSTNPHHPRASVSPNSNPFTAALAGFGAVRCASLMPRSMPTGSGQPGTALSTT